MQTRLFRILVTALLCSAARAADLSEALQQGLLEEEANQNLNAAIQAYQAVLKQFDDQRRIAATATFRLAESYRKQGKTNEARVQYARVLSDFADQIALVKPSQQYLAANAAGSNQSFQTRLNTIVRRAESEPSTGFQNRLQAIVRRDESDAPTEEEGKEIQRVQEIIKNSPDLINDRGVSGQTRLHIAAAGGQLIVARFLLDNNAEVNSTTTGKGAVGGVADQTPLHVAAWAGHKAMVELLLSRGAKVNARDSSGETPLHKAASRGFQAVAQVLLDKGAEVDAQGASGQTPLQLAVVGRFKGMIELLLAHHAQFDLANSYGQAALILAVQTKQLALVQLILDNHAEINSKAKDGHTALTVSVQQRTGDITGLLIARGADPNVKAHFQMDGLDARVQDWTPLHYATYVGDIALTESLLQHGAEVDARDTFGRTPLAWDVIQKNVPLVKLLLAKGADPSVKDVDGQTPLSFVAQAYEAQQSRALQPPNQPWASAPVRPELTELLNTLIDHEAKLNDWSERMAPPLIWGVFYGDSNLVVRLLDKGAEINLKSVNGYTALHVAAASGATNLIEMLLAKGADINAQDDAGNTPLHYAAFNARKSAVELLIAHGARTDLANRQDVLPDKIATAYGPSQPLNYQWGIPVKNTVPPPPYGIPIRTMPTREQRDISELLRQHLAPPPEK